MLGRFGDDSGGSEHHAPAAGGGINHGVDKFPWQTAPHKDGRPSAVCATQWPPAATPSTRSPGTQRLGRAADDVDAGRYADADYSRTSLPISRATSCSATTAVGSPRRTAPAGVGLRLIDDASARSKLPGHAHDHHPGVNNSRVFNLKADWLCSRCSPPVPDDVFQDVHRHQIPGCFDAGRAHIPARAG